MSFARENRSSLSFSFINSHYIEKELVYLKLETTEIRAKDN